MRADQIFCFFAGFVISGAFTLYFIGLRFDPNEERRPIHQSAKGLLRHNGELYDDTLSDILYSEVKVLCMVMTYPDNHQTKAIHVKETWGRQCNKLLFMSSELDENLDVVILPVEDSRKELWNKTKSAFKYLYENHIDEFDWFLKADDDNYIIVDNLRYMLSQYNSRTALYFGHRYAAPYLDDGYMAGGGYILSKKALEKFGQKLLYHHGICHEKGGAEDAEIGRCLAHSAIFVDCRDEKHQKRFFPAGVTYHMKTHSDPNYWYSKSLYYRTKQGGLDCCSEFPIMFHYIGPHEIHGLEYFINRVHPFGLERQEDIKPRKLRLKEIIAASDYESPAPNFKRHKIYHALESSEIYSKRR